MMSQVRIDKNQRIHSRKVINKNKKRLPCKITTISGRICWFLKNLSEESKWILAFCHKFLPLCQTEEHVKKVKHMVAIFFWLHTHIKLPCVKLCSVDCQAISRIYYFTRAGRLAQKLILVCFVICFSLRIGSRNMELDLNENVCHRWQAKHFWGFFFHLSFASPDTEICLENVQHNIS